MPPAMIKHTPPKDHVDLALEDGLSERLARAAASIRRDARGRTCGDCMHLRGNWCAEQVNIDGDNLTVNHLNAVACAKHEVRA